MNSLFKMYEVGGKVRDELLGLQSKDIDYVAVPELNKLTKNITIEQVFDLLIEELKIRGYEIFLITPKMLTIRAKNPLNKETADFVVARKEIGYIEGTREPIVVPGTLYDDLQRRDFTVNAIAKDTVTGEYIDPFNGLKDIKTYSLRTPISGEITFGDDPLRILRAIRFAITKKFGISSEIDEIITNFPYKEKFGVVSEERIREELHKCFKYNTKATLGYLTQYPALKYYIFNFTKLWLKPTNEQ